MAKTLKDLMKEIINLDYDSKLNTAGEAFDDLVDVLLYHGYDKEEITSLVADLIRVFASADNILSKKEYEFANELFELGISYEEFCKKCSFGSSKGFIKTIDEIIDTLSIYEKYPISILGICIFSVDGNISIKEQELLMKLLY